MAELFLLDTNNISFKENGDIIENFLKKLPKSISEKINKNSKKYLTV